MALIEVFTADPGGAVGHHHAAQSDFRNRMGGPDIRTCQQLYLLFEGEAVGEFADPGLGVRGIRCRGQYGR